MLITKTEYDVKSNLKPDGRPVRIYIIAPNVPNYPQAKFPGEHGTADLRDTLYSDDIYEGVVVFR